MTKPFKELRDKMSPEARERAHAKAQKIIEEMALEELRQARKLTQEHLAEILKIRQSAVSKMEKRADMYISTLSRFIEAMGGQLEIRANFPEGSVRISQFKGIAAANVGA